MKKAPTAYFIFYNELQDFLLPAQRDHEFIYHFTGNPSIKDAIEAIGIPHTEVDVILIKKTKKKFSYQLQDQDLIKVFPNRKKLRGKPKFILDVHLGKLARYLRLLGFDALYNNHCGDKELVRLASLQKRVLLTRDKGLLKYKKLKQGYWLRNTDPKLQMKEIIKRFSLNTKQLKPFTRCLECNGKIRKITAKVAKQQRLPAKTRKYFKNFYRCTQCQKIYWQGSHYEKLRKILIGWMKDENLFDAS